MLYLNLQRIATLRNITNLQKHLTQNGFSANIAHRISKRSDSNIKFQYLEQLCLLFRCTPNDLLHWDAEPGTATDSHPLQALIHQKNTDNLSQYLKTASIEELAEFHKKNTTTP